MENLHLILSNWRYGKYRRYYMNNARLVLRVIFYTFVEGVVEIPGRSKVAWVKKVYF